MYEIFFKSITEENVEIKSVNSNFKVNFYEKGISIKIDNDDEAFNFELKCGASYYDSSKEYHYQKCSDELERTFKSEEDELFKRIFVRIDECPEFLRIALRIDREEQLRKEKCLKLRKKYFRFFRKGFTKC